MSFGQQLKQIREQFGDTQESLAAKLEMSKGAIANYEKEDRQPSYDILAKIAKLYKVSLDWLILGEGNRTLDYNPEVNNFKSPKEYRVLASVPAGIGEIQDRTEVHESDILDFDPADHAFIIVDQEFGYSMMPTISPGDMVLISFKDKVKSNDLVAARWDKTKGAIKILSLGEKDKTKGALLSYNLAVPPIYFEDIRKIKLYRVVLIKKNKPVA